MDNTAPELKIFTTLPFKEKVYIPDDPGDTVQVKREAKVLSPRFI